ncbi:HAMP domain-containing sensor histidine kinase [Erysipelothrix rhusiopathiae]|nr:HAMP domain-containing sensor histidine kinase [Erysipelothrix rhusiopathiae]MDE8293180.1 HAMP domain-containing sensor histidine kinase [Erysipelothrix rhusiopathiae]
MIYIIIVLLVITLIFFGIYIVYIRNDIKSINAQLQYILSNNTNAEITHVTRNSLMINFVTQTNLIIRKIKDHNRKSVQHEKEIHQTLSSLSHDLRTPMTTAYGYINLLETQLPNNELLPKVKSSIEEATQYLDTIVSYTSINERAVALELKRMSLTDFISQQVLQYYDSFNEIGIDVDLKIENNVQIISDEVLLKRVTTNLMGNILKHGKGNCYIELSKDSNNLKLMFENKILHQAEDFGEIKKRFVTQDVSRSNKSVGLGLSIVDKCVEVLGGTFEIEKTADTFIATVNFQIQ